MNNIEAWDYAIGMVRGAGLEPTDEFKECIEKEKKGETTMEELKRFLDGKYKQKVAKDARVALAEPFRHKTLEERAAEFDGKLRLDGEYDWGESVGREVW